MRSSQDSRKSIDNVDSLSHYLLFTTSRSHKRHFQRGGVVVGRVGVFSQPSQVGSVGIRETYLT